MNKDVYNVVPKEQVFFDIGYSRGYD